MSTAESQFNLGMTLRAALKLPEASLALAAAAEQDPARPDIRYELANTYRDLYRFADAEREIRVVIGIQPDYPKAYSALGVILLESGRAAEAVEAFAEAMRVDPQYANATTNWVSAQQYVPGVTPQQLAESHAHWNARHAPALPVQEFSNSRIKDRPLTVGFVSPDFCRHPVGFLSVRLFENLDRSQIRPIAFSTRPDLYEDDMSARIAKVTNWTTVFGLSDDNLAILMKALKVDILFDLSGHLANNRLSLFARKAAPLQISWLGYTGTTGLAAMDYVLADNILTPPRTEAHFVERIARLPHWFACFDPPVDAPVAGPAPFTKNGFITFGCFNNSAKLNDQVIASFVRNSLKRVPSSVLKLKYKSLGDPALQAHLRAAFATHGIASERIHILGQSQHGDFLAAYNEIDIALDTFPYSGCMTTCEASWMGCPTVTFPGATFAGRHTAAFLTGAGLSALIAKDQAHVEDLAVELANDPARLSYLHANLRSQIASAPVCDGPRFAADFAATLRALWHAWCDESVIASLP